MQIEDSMKTRVFVTITFIRKFQAASLLNIYQFYFTILIVATTS